jgi:hypothetical protein
MRFKDITNFIRADWIRPEDIDFYQSLGIDSVKLTDRRLSTQMIIRIINAYVNKSYSGNLIDLFPAFQGKSFSIHQNWPNKIFYFRNFIFMNPIKLFKFVNLMYSLDIYIDNSHLNNFLLDMPKDCSPIFCANCSYCKEVALRVVKINPSYLEDITKKYQEALNVLL